MNIDELIAGPDPLGGDAATGVSASEADATYATVMARAAEQESVQPRRRRRVFVGTGAFASAAAAVALVVTSLGSVVPTGSVAGAAELRQVAAHIQTATTTPPSGDATLVVRTAVNSGGPTVSTTELYADDGEYFVAPTESQLAAAVAAGATEGNGFAEREVNAALDALKGDVSAAVQEMADAQDDNGEPPATNAGQDGAVWTNSVDALIAGAGNPDVRAGVLRILATLSEVAVTNTTTSGQSTMTLTASAPATSADYQEAVTIDASSGVPVLFTGGVPGQSPNIAFTLQVSRVTVADVAAGKF